MSIACVSCAETLPDGSRFCSRCGAEQTAPSCASCGAAVRPDARFCLSCGAATDASTQPTPGPDSAGPVASRRVTSVLFGDLVGFTTLSESRDQEEVRELLSRYFEECRRVIARYGGTVEKFIGDAVMAVWGVPSAHEDDAERAVRAGLELVDAVTSMREAVGVVDLAMRVGVVTGEVAVTVGATQEGMVAGDAVNTAARVQTAATPGQVWVDETTRLLTASAITYLDVGSHAMKGKAEPVPLWSVRAVVSARGGAQRADGLEAPLIGRDRELRLCKELFHGAEESQLPRLLVVEGDPGVGKTRLAWEFEKYSDGLDSDVLWHSGRCLAYGEGVAFFALAEAFRGRLRSFDDPDDQRRGDPDEDDDEAALLERGLARLVPDESERAWLRPRVGALLGIGSVGSFPREDLFSAWTTFVERAGAGSPVVLVIDDAQHADEGLLQFVEHLLAVAGFPCFVVLLTRPGLLEARPALAVNRRATVVHLESLAPADMGSLISGLVAGLPDDARDRLVTRAEGVPLYAVETVRSLIDRDLVVPRGGQYVLADGAELDLDGLKAPASLQALVAARLDTLTPDQRRVVDRASVLGEVFSRESLAGLGTDIENVSAVLDSLLRQQILSHENRRFSAEVGLYRFVQSVVRQVAYSRLSRRDRKALHLAIAARMEAEEGTGDVAAVVAQHYLDAVEAVPADPDADQLRDSAVTHLERAAARAAGLGGQNEAAAHLTVALSLVCSPDRVAALEARLAEALEHVGRYEEAIGHAQRAEELLLGLGDRVGAARVAATRAAAISVGLRDNDAALAVLKPWWEELNDRSPDEVEVLFRLCSEMISAESRMGINEWPLMEAQVALAERTGDPRLLCHTYSSVAVYFGLAGSSTLGRVLLHAAADLARASHDPVSLARILNNLAAEDLADHCDRSVETAREGFEVSTRAGSSVWRSFTGANLVLGLFSRGDWDELATMMRDEEHHPDDGNIMLWWAVSGMLARARGTEPERATGELVDALVGDSTVDQSWLDLCQALLEDRRGDRHRASTLATAAVNGLHDFAGIWDDLPFVWVVAVDLAMAAADTESLDALMALAGRSSRTAAAPLSLKAHIGRAKAVLARADGDLVEAERLLRVAVDDYASWGSLPYGARARAELAGCLHELGRDDEAAAMLEPALATLRDLGASAWIEELDPAFARVTSSGRAQS